MKNAVLIVCVLAAFLAGFALGWKMKPHEIDIQLRADLRKPIPVLYQKDVIHWLQPDGTPMTVQFPKNFSPCKEGEAVADCHMKYDRGVFPYDCPECDDPVVPVGRSNGIEFTQKARSLAAHTPLGIYCSDADHKTFVLDQTAQPGNEFKWVASGLNPPKWWKVTFTESGACEGSDVFGSDPKLTNYCKVTGNKTYYYKAESKVGETVCEPFTATLNIVKSAEPVRQ